MDFKKKYINKIKGISSEKLNETEKDILLEAVIEEVYEDGYEDGLNDQQ